MNELSLAGMLLAGLLGISSTRVMQISTGEQTTCAVLGDGALKCWGINALFVRARGAQEVAAEMPALVPRIDLGRDASGAYRPVAAVATSNHHACAIMGDDRSVKCWGDPLYSHDRTLRGTPDEMGNALPAVRLGPGARARSIAVSNAHSCAVLEDNTVKCWGKNLGGELGQGDVADRLTYNESRDTIPPIDLGTHVVVRSVTAGSFRTCALLDQEKARGIVKCWGGDDFGGAAPGSMGEALPRIDFGERRHAVSVQMRGHHTYALLDDGSIKCWGYNSGGQLGIGSTLNLRLPSQSVNLGRGGLTAIGIGVGAYSSCAILSNQTVKCWGQIASHEPGSSRTDRGVRPEELGDALRPINLGRGQTAESVSVGYFHACAILSGGTAKCWGFNGNGQLGTGDREDRRLPHHLGDALPFLNFGNPVSQVQNE